APGSSCELAASEQPSRNVESIVPPLKKSSSTQSSRMYLKCALRMVNPVSRPGSSKLTPLPYAKTVRFSIRTPTALLWLPGIIPYLSCIVVHDVAGGNWPRISPPDQQRPDPPPTRTTTFTDVSSRNCAVVASIFDEEARLVVS